MSKQRIPSPLLALVFLPVLLVSPAAVSSAAAHETAWITLQGQVADAPFTYPVDAVLQGDELWAVGPVDRLEADGFALAQWRRDASGLLRFSRAYTREELGLETLSRIHALAISADGQFFYLGGRTFSFESRLFVLARSGEELVVVQSLGNLPDSANESKMLITPDGRHLYYGSRGIVTCERDVATGLLERKGLVSSAAVIDLSYDAERQQLFSIGEEVLHVWQRDSESGALTSLGLFDELQLAGDGGQTLRFSSGRRLARSADGRFLYALAFGPALTRDPWALLVFELQTGLPLLAGRGLGGSTGDVYPSALALSADQSLLLTFSSLPGGSPALANHPALDGGRSFGPASSRLSLPGDAGAEVVLGPLVLPAAGEVLAGHWDGAHWQRFSLELGQLTRKPTFAGTQRMQQPVDLALTADGRQILVAVPAADAVVQLGYRQGILAFEGATRTAARRLLVLPDGRHGVLLEASGLVLRLFRLQEGQVVPIGEPVPVAGEISELAASPDGSRVYAVGVAGSVFRVDVAAERLVPLGALPVGGSRPPRVSPDGRFVLLNQRYQGVFPFFLSDWLEFDPVTGLYRAFDDAGTGQDELVDAVFSPAGDFFYAFKGGFDPRLAVYPRHPRTGVLGDVLQEERSVPGSEGIFDFEGQLEIDADGRFLYLLRQDDEKLIVYERDPRSGRVRHVETFAAADGTDVLVGGLELGSRQRFVVSASGNEVFLMGGAQGRVSLLRHHCQADDPRSLCLGEDGRFRAEMSYFLPRAIEGSAQRIEAPSVDSGLFQFFSANNWESLVKVLDGCGLNDHFWVYAATASDLAITLKVTDTWTGYRAQWHQAAGAARPAIADSVALPVCAANPGEGVEATATGAGSSSDSVEPELILGGGRFSVRATWRTAGGQQGDAQVVPFGSDDSGLFTFFDPNNWEVLVKVLDGCQLNGRYWFYAASATDVGLRIEVRDLIGNKTRVYENPLGQTARSITDIQAFDCN